MSCDFRIEKYVPLVDPKDFKANGVCRWPDWVQLPCSDGTICQSPGPAGSADHVFTVQFPAGSFTQVEPGDVGSPTALDGPNGFRPLAGTCGPPTDRFVLYSVGYEGNLVATPPATHVRIFAGLNCVMTKVFEGVYDPPSVAEACDFVVQVVGPLGTNWQLWAVVDATAQPTPYTWKIAAALDRSRALCSVPWPICLGENTTQVFPPVGP